MASRVPLPGSFQTEPESASPIGELNKTEETSVTVYLKKGPPAEEGSTQPALLADLQRRATTRQLLLAQCIEEYAEAADALERFARSHGLRFRADLGRRCVH